MPCPLERRQLAVPVVRRHDLPREALISRVAPIETGAWEFWDYLPGPGDVAMVLGAGLGNEVSTVARLVGPSGRVYAFEAHPATFAHLVRLCQVNRWANVEPVHAAITDRSGTVTISDDESFATNDIWRDEGIEVDACSLDDFVRDRDIARVDLIAMNIEGAERLAVDGMASLAPLVRHASISCHDFIGVEEKATKAYVRAALLDLGFALRERSDHPHPVVRHVLYASRMSSAVSVTTARDAHSDLGQRSTPAHAPDHAGAP